MSRLGWIGAAIAAGAAGHLGARTVGRVCRRGTRFMADWLAAWMDGLDDLAPGRLVHGQADEGGRQISRSGRRRREPSHR